MYLKAFCLAILACQALANEELLHALYGVHGLNRVSVCMGPVDAQVAALAECAGAVWRRRWVAARASCVAARPATRLAVLRVANGVTCDDVHRGEESPYLNKVRAQFVHPKYVGSVSPQYNLALLALERPYDTADALANTTAVHNLLAEYAQWMDDIDRNSPGGNLLRRSYVQQKQVFTSPMRMFITTVVLPSACFIVFFLFLTFFTSPKNKPAYKDIRCKEEMSLV